VLESCCMLTVFNALSVIDRSGSCSLVAFWVATRATMQQFIQRTDCSADVD